MDLAEEVATLNGDLAAKLASVEWSRDGVGLRIMDQPGKRHGKALILSRSSRCFWACDVCTEDLFQGVGWHANIVLRHLCGESSVSQLQTLFKLNYICDTLFRYFSAW